MSILIKGLQMPKGDKALVVVINSNGTVDRPNWQWDCTLVKGAEAIPLSNHGDLIDREYAVGSACSGRVRALPTTEDGEDWIRVEEVRQSLKSVPAVIPAERSEASLCDNCDWKNEKGCSWCKRMERSKDGET